MPKNQKISPHAIAIGLAFNTLLFLVSAYAFALVAALIFGVLERANRFSPHEPDTLFVEILCIGWLVIKVFCDFAAGIGASSFERSHTRLNIIVLTCLSLVCTALGVFLVVNFFWPLPTPLWYIFASPLAALIMPSAGAFFVRRRASKTPQAVVSSAPPIPEVPSH